MSENTEQQAESAILAAVMTPDVQDVNAPNARLDDPQQIDAIEEEVAAEAEPEADKPEAKAEQAEPEEDYVEVAGADGAEPTKIKLAEVLEGYQQFKAIEAQKAEVIERVEQEVTARATEQLRQVEQFGKQTAFAIEAALRLLQPPQRPQPPDPSLRHRDWAAWDDANASYQQQMYQYEQANTQFQQARQLGAQLMQQAEAAQARISEERETRELQRLQRAWPEFGQRETIDKFVSDMGKAYGYSPEELDASLNDHRNALVARDALAYRAMKAQSGDVKKQVEAKAPKLVRSKQESKGGGAQSRDAKGQFVAGTFQRAMKSQSDDDWAAHFAALSKANRI